MHGDDQAHENHPDTEEQPPITSPFPVDAWTDPAYPAWFEAHRATEADLERQRSEADSLGGTTFSIIVPLYKTPLDYLRDCVESVLAQSYPHFQLVLVNASPELAELAQAVADYATRDSRITVVALEENLGITENTNAGLAAATGDFACFLDHDDIIEPDALFEYASAIAADPATDVLYCDEDLLHCNPAGKLMHQNPLFKPSFSPELLLCKNYAIHLLGIRRTLIESLPAPDSGYDGSQDYNLLLRCADAGRHVHNVERVLYHWRVSETSTATNYEEKPYSETSAIRIQQEELERRGIAGEVFATDILGSHVIRFSSQEGQPISLIVDCGAERGTDESKPDIESFCEKLAQMPLHNVAEIVFVGCPSETRETAIAALDATVKFAGAPTDAAGRYASFNVGAAAATGDFLVFLDAGCSSLTQDPWEQLSALCTTEGVGATAPKTIYRTGHVKGFGIAITPESIMPLYRGYNDDFPGYECALRAFQNTSAAGVQGLCTPRALFNELGGFDASFSDELGAVDYCTRVRKAGYRIAMMPTVKLEIDEVCPCDRFNPTANSEFDFATADIARFDGKHPGVRSAGDPYLNSNLCQRSPYFRIPQTDTQGKPWEPPMMSFKIMNILLSEAGQFVNEPSLLCRSTKPWRHGFEAGTWLLEGPGKHDFMTYFNALSSTRWREYTVAQAFSLHLELRGAAASIVETRADAFDRIPVPVEATRVGLTASDAWQAVDIPLVEAPGDVLLSFLVECEGDVEIRNAHFSANVDPVAVRETELALCTTTFKKEDYILHNIELVRREILDGDELIGGHFRMHVVDNGRTLDSAALSHGGVTVHPNPNAGGAGGFARGMMEAMAQKPRATHVLLMDDDVSLSPESIIRTFNLLSIVRDEYAEAFIGGAMMNMEEPAVLFEDSAFMCAGGYCAKIKPSAHEDCMHSVVMGESFDVPSYLPGCEDQNQRYQAWWYCCIPMTQIERNGLPLPLFVRYDDVEYGLRCKPRFITLNGICVWHMPFFMRYSAAQECYQTTRNSLINSFACPDFAPLSDFEGTIRTNMDFRLKTFNYADAELICQGVEDFLQGPEWLMDPASQSAFLDANKVAEKFRPFDEAYDEVAALGIDLNNETDWKIYRDAPISRKSHAVQLLSFNGQRGPDFYTDPNKAVTLDAFNFKSGYGRFKRANVIVAVDVPNRKVAIRHRDRARFAEIHRRFKADMKELNTRRDELRAAWSAAFPAMTSETFWKKYLGLDADPE